MRLRQISVPLSGVGITSGERGSRAGRGPLATSQTRRGLSMRVDRTRGAEGGLFRRGRGREMVGRIMVLIRGIKR